MYCKTKSRESHCNKRTSSVILATDTSRTDIFMPNPESPKRIISSIAPDGSLAFYTDHYNPDKMTRNTSPLEDRYWDTRAPSPRNRFSRERSISPMLIYRQYSPPRSASWRYRSRSPSVDKRYRESSSDRYVEHLPYYRRGSGDFLPEPFYRFPKHVGRSKSSGGYLPYFNDFEKYDHFGKPQVDGKVNRVLYVGNLELSITQAALGQLFSKFGEIDDIFLEPLRKKTKKKVKYAFVNYKNLIGAYKAKNELHRKTVAINEYPLMVGYGKIEPTQTVWIGNVPAVVASLGDQKLKDFILKELDRFGVIKKCDFYRGKSELIVHYESLDAAIQAREQLRGMWVEGVDIRITEDNDIQILTMEDKDRKCDKIKVIDNEYSRSRSRSPQKSRFSFYPGEFDFGVGLVTDFVGPRGSSRVRVFDLNNSATFTKSGSHIKDTIMKGDQDHGSDNDTCSPMDTSSCLQYGSFSCASFYLTSNGAYEMMSPHSVTSEPIHRSPQTNTRSSATHTLTTPQSDSTSGSGLLGDQTPPPSPNYQSLLNPSIPNEGKNLEVLKQSLTLDPRSKAKSIKNQILNSSCKQSTTVNASDTSNDNSQTDEDILAEWWSELEKKKRRSRTVINEQVSDNDSIVQNDKADEPKQVEPMLNDADCEVIE